MDGMQKKMHCMYCSMPKGTSWAEGMLNSKPVALAITELHLSEVSQ